MEAPKCQFCGKVEWRHVCDQTPILAKKVVKVENVTAEKRVVKVENLTCPVCEARRKKHREDVRKWRERKG